MGSSVSRSKLIVISVECATDPRSDAEAAGSHSLVRHGSKEATQMRRQGAEPLEGSDTLA